MSNYPPSYTNVQTNNEARVSHAVSTSAVELAPANNSRRYFSVFNNSATAVLYLDFDNPAVSTTNAAFALQPHQTYFSDNYNTSAAINGIWDTADAAGSANIREYS